MLSPKKLALIHVAKKQTGLTEAEYRDLLAGFGAQSSKQLDGRQFDALLNHFKKLGFRSTSAYHKPVESKKRLMAKVHAIKADMGLSERYIDGMVKRMRFSNRDGELISSFRWLDAGQLHRLVAALTYHQQRTAKRCR